MLCASSARMSSLVATPAVSLRPGRAFVPVIECKQVSTRKSATQKRHQRIRRKVSGTAERPRLAVYRSNNHIYAQVIDDTVGRTLAAASTLSKDMKESLNEVGTANKEAAAAVGKKLAELCAEKNISKVCFDRGGFAYHGRVEAVADAAREAGLSF